MLILVSCNEPSTPPTDTLDGMFIAMKKGDVDNMKNYITSADGALLDAAEKIMSKLDPEGMKKIKTKMIDEFKEQAKNIAYSFKNERIDGDYATVEAVIVNNNLKTTSRPKTITQTFELVKENNRWKIALSKPGNQMFNSMKGNMGSKKVDLKTGVQKLQQMNPDSLKMLINKGLKALDSLDKKKKTP